MTGWQMFRADLRASWESATAWVIPAGALMLTTVYLGGPPV